MSGFRPFLDSNLGAAFFFSSVSMALPQLFQAVLVYFRQSVAQLFCFSCFHVILVKSIASSIIHKISVNSSLAKALALVPLDATLLGTTLATLSAPFIPFPAKPDPALTCE
jgi:hypothetical protein